MLAAGMLITGSINTLTTKAADMQSTADRNGNKYDQCCNPMTFNHPFVQAAGMFIGEFLCLLAFKVLLWRAAYDLKHHRNTADNLAQVERKPFPKYLLILPALCDMTATSAMYVGLNWSSASAFQMLRGSVVSKVKRPRTS